MTENGKLFGVPRNLPPRRRRRMVMRRLKVSQGAQYCLGDSVAQPVRWPIARMASRSGECGEEVHVGEKPPPFRQREYGNESMATRVRQQEYSKKSTAAPSLGFMNGYAVLCNIRDMIARQSHVKTLFGIGSLLFSTRRRHALCRTGIYYTALTQNRKRLLVIKPFCQFSFAARAMLHMTFC